MVACKVTPAIWLNLSDSRNILIIHFGLLLKERTIDSIGHDLWKKYNVTSFFIDNTLYFFVNKHIYTVDSYWCIVGLNSTRRHNGVDTSITLDAAKWNYDGAELSSCVITLFYWIMYYNIRNSFGTNLSVDFYPFVLCTYIYVYVSYVL